MQAMNCPVCKLKGGQRKSHPRAGPDEFKCCNCGSFRLDDGASHVVQDTVMAPITRAALSHGIWKMQRPDAPPPTLFADLIKSLAQTPLPTPAEQANLALQRLGDITKDPSAQTRCEPAHFAAKIGACGVEGVRYVLGHLRQQGLVDIDHWDDGLSLGRGQKGDPVECRLSFSGWQRYEELQRGRADTRKAFMAMPFRGEYAESVLVVYKAFQGAVDKTGFHLVNDLREKPRAGLIDDHLRVEIRLAHFLIADLTGGNHGAYWEAGFAEGLGKTVIYSCQKEWFEKPGTHFDTNHCQTIVWSEHELGEACAELKDVIRNTLPESAIMASDNDASPSQEPSTCQ